MNSHNLRQVAFDIAQAYAMPDGFDDLPDFDVSYGVDPDTFEPGQPDRFTMAIILGEWEDQSTADCGTCGCVASFAAWSANCRETDTTSIQISAQNWLECSDDQASALFFPWQHTAPPSEGGAMLAVATVREWWLKISPEEGAAVLRFLADEVDEGRAPDWRQIVAAWDTRQALAEIPRCHWCGHHGPSNKHSADCGRPFPKHRRW